MSLVSCRQLEESMHSLLFLGMASTSTKLGVTFAAGLRWDEVKCICCKIVRNCQPRAEHSAWTIGEAVAMSVPCLRAEQAHLQGPRHVVMCMSCLRAEQAHPHGPRHVATSVPCLRAEQAHLQGPLRVAMGVPWLRAEQAHLQGPRHDAADRPVIDGVLPDK